MRDSKIRDTMSSHFTALISDGPLEAWKPSIQTLLQARLGEATVRLTGKECKEEPWTVLAMTGSSITFIQINLNHSKCVSAVLARNMAVMQTGIAIIQEPWRVKGIIRGLGSCGMVYRANTTEQIWGCIFIKGTHATLLPQFSCSNLLVLQLKLQIVTETDRDVIAGSVCIYIPHYSRDWPPQEEVKRLVTHVKDRRLELLLGFNANSHMWSTDINLRGECLLDFIVGAEMHILNRGTEPTFPDSIRREITDITICTLRVINLWEFAVFLVNPHDQITDRFILPCNRYK